MDPSHSVSQWITALKNRDQDAAQRLWDRYAAELLALARRRLNGLHKSIADEEDIAQSVFRSVCRGAGAGRFSDVRTRDDLWWLLLAITKQKVIDHARWEYAQKRDARNAVRESEVSVFAQFSLDSLVGNLPTPEFVMALDEESNRLMTLLRDDTLRQIASLRIEGYTSEEIAAKVCISSRSVERKISLIRTAWAKELLVVH